MLSTKANPIFFKENHDTLGGARDERGLSTTPSKFTDIERPEAIDIFRRGDSSGDSGLGNVFGDGQLNQDSVDRGVIVQVLDFLEELGLGNVFVEFDEIAGDVGLCRWLVKDFLSWLRTGTNLFGGLKFHAHIGRCRRLIVRSRMFRSIYIDRGNFDFSYKNQIYRQLKIPKHQ